MKQSTAIKRLALPSAMLIFLLLSLAYWWLNNISHELFGSILFAFLSWHIVSNRLWFKNIFKGRYNLRRSLSTLLHLLLIANMTVLFVTSVAVSKSIFAFFTVSGTTTMQTIHLFSAYWVMITVGIHVGLHWKRVISGLCLLLKLPKPNMISAWILRLAATFIFILGINSLTPIDIWNKLTFTYSLAFWDFTDSVSPFFGHWIAIISLPAIATHYAMLLIGKSSSLIAYSKQLRN